MRVCVCAYIVDAVFRRGVLDVPGMVKAVFLFVD
jgi:hypothetical protein